MASLTVFILLLLTVACLLFKTIDILAIPLFIIFLILQLCGVIAWAWVLVFLPFIIWVCSMLLIIGTIFLLTVLDKVD